MVIRQYFLRCSGLVGLVYWVLSAIAAPASRAETVLTRADVESFQNRVEILLRGGPTRPVRLSDRLGTGDAVRTDTASQVDLRFNDGSFARVGELATFWFIPNTRDFRLSNGTVLFLVPPGNGSSTIETPNVVVGIQGTAIVVRHFPSPDENLSEQTDPLANLTGDTGRTAVMVLTDSPGGPAEIKLQDGRSVNVSSGEVAIVDNGNLYLFEFDLGLFYETSPLLEGLFLEDANYLDSSPTAPVRQEMVEGLENQQDFAGDYFLNPSFLSPDTDISTGSGWLFPINPASPVDESATESTENLDDDAGISAPHEGTADLEGELSPPETIDMPSIDNPPAPTDGTDGDVLPPGVITPIPNETSPVPQQSGEEQIPNPATSD
ncbi:FecR family protein [Oscillatoria sp. CS-180]|uniref:FecR family protein n=1 Tax=Oscillatoria sp. CS-180 TaxID=3021720 RepID=UPI00232FA332|nr:FecR family protein [Oscillatoria sp. CS-180]MDB9525154.1 FecR family protein [Oscillatoria sp. CS-180]